MKFKIKHFDDYHEIESDTCKAVELGCFPVAKCGYYRYFGLFYSGRRPSKDKIIKGVLSKVKLGKFDLGNTGLEIGTTKTAVVSEITKALAYKE